MGPRSDNRGYACEIPDAVVVAVDASMGPRSDNRGYGAISRRIAGYVQQLQWVHGPITVVMHCMAHGRGDRGITASMGPRSDNRGYDACSVMEPLPLQQASMGPRSDNRGYAMDTPPAWPKRIASMGPRSDNRGYVRGCTVGRSVAACKLQWVHGPITVVMHRR